MWPKHCETYRYNRAKLVFLIIAKFEMLLCSFSADDCSSCVQRSFKANELLKKACYEYDFGKKRLIDELKQPRTVLVSSMYSTVGILTGSSVSERNIDSCQYKTKICRCSPRISLRTQDLVDGDIHYTGIVWSP